MPRHDVVQVTKTSVGESAAHQWGCLSSVPSRPAAGSLAGDGDSSAGRLRDRPVSEGCVVAAPMVAQP